MRLNKLERFLVVWRNFMKLSEISFEHLVYKTKVKNFFSIL